MDKWGGVSLCCQVLHCQIFPNPGRLLKDGVSVIRHRFTGQVTAKDGWIKRMRLLRCWLSSPLSTILDDQPKRRSLLISWFGSLLVFLFFLLGIFASSGSFGSNDFTHSRASCGSKIGAMARLVCKASDFERLARNVCWSDTPNVRFNCIDRSRAT